MKEEKERLSAFERFRERHERFDNFCYWVEGHWEDVVIYSLSTVIIVLTAIFVTILFTSCSNEDDNAIGGSDPTTATWTVAVVAPIGDAATKTRLQRTADWFLDNFREAQQGNATVIKLQLDWFDELSEDHVVLGKELSVRSDVVAVVGPFGNEAVGKFAPACKRQQKAMIVPTATSEELQHIFAVASSNSPMAGKPFFWPLTEPDVRLCERLMSLSQADAVLFAPKDKYGRTFTDWAPFHAGNLGVSLTDNISYADDAALTKAVGDHLRNTSGGDDFYVVEDMSQLSAVARLHSHLPGEDAPRSWFAFNTLSDEMLDALGSDDLAAAEGCQGLMPYADPATGFEDAYKARYGISPTLAECKLYDALLLAALATVLYEETSDTPDNPGIDNTRFNDCIRAIACASDDIDQQTADPVWSAATMRTYLTSLPPHPSPLTATSGPILFDAETCTQKAPATYLHWQIQDGRLCHRAYLSPEEPASPTIHYDDLIDQYAVLVHGSKGFANYRHLADVLCVYQLLRRNGFDDDHIILIIDRALALDPQNEEPGIIRFSPDGQDLLGGTDGLPKAAIDYDAADLSPEDISKILLNVGSEGRNILLYWSGHGKKSYFSWRDAKEGFTADRLRVTAEHMQCRKLCVIAETCYGGSVIAPLEGLPGVIAMSAADATEESWADNWHTSMLVWMCDRFTKNFVEFLSDRPADSYRDLYLYTRARTLNSHPEIVNAANFGNLSAESPGEFFTQLQPPFS